MAVLKLMWGLVLMVVGVVLLAVAARWFLDVLPAVIALFR